MKEKINYIIKSYGILILIIIIASIFRLNKLGNIPIWMTDDELRETLSSYSVWFTHRDLLGNLLPFSFNIHGYAYAPVPIYIGSIFIGLLGLDSFSARLPYAIFGILTVLLMYAVGMEIIKNKFISLTSSLLMGISVWHIQVSRLAHEGGISLFMYLLGTLVFLKVTRGNLRKLFISLLILFLAFYCYSATKVIFIPLICILLLYKRKEFQTLQIVMTTVAILFILLSFVFLSATQNANQYANGQMFFLDTKKTNEAVELQRRASIAPEILKRIYNNKINYWKDIFINQYSYAFSPQYLFTSQEASGIYSIRFRGQMYLIEAPLLLLGLLYLFEKRRKEFFLLFSLLLISPLPSGVGVASPTYTMRSIFMLPWLMIITATGIFAIKEYIYRISHVRIIYAGIFLVYLYLVSAYVYQYYFEWVKYGSKYFSDDIKQVLDYTNTHKNNNIVISTNATHFFLHYSFYNKLSAYAIQNNFSKEKIVFNNVTLNYDCLNFSDNNLSLKAQTIYIQPVSCKTNKIPVQYIKVDGTEMWNIY